MKTFLKAQGASFAASVVDYGVTILLVNVLKVLYLVGTATGTILGGITNFYISRVFVFEKKAQPSAPQLFRYVLVWVGYLLLSTGGIYLVTEHLHVNYLVSKIGVTLLLAVGWNYPLQKYFVFR